MIGIVLSGNLSSRLFWELTSLFSFLLMAIGTRTRAPATAHAWLIVTRQRALPVWRVLLIGHIVAATT